MKKGVYSFAMETEERWYFVPPGREIGVERW